MASRTFRRKPLQSYCRAKLKSTSARLGRTFSWPKECMLQPTCWSGFACCSCASVVLNELTLAPPRPLLPLVGLRRLSTVTFFQHLDFLRGAPPFGGV